MYRHTNVLSYLNHLSTAQTALAVGGVVLISLLSVTRPTLLRDAITGAAKRIWRRLVHLFSYARPGIRIGDARISDEARLRHTHIVGATGSGKSILMEQMILEDIKRGQGMLIIDPKGERYFREKVEHLCKKAGRKNDFHLLSATQPHLSARWNPCRMGSPSEVQSKLYNAGVYHEPFYAKACEFALIEAISRLCGRSAAPFTLNEVEREIKRLNPQKEQEAHIQGVYLDLHNLLESEWGPVLCAKPFEDTKKEISLLDVARKNEILFVELPTEGKSVQSARIGRLLLQEILLVSGLRKRFPVYRSDKPFSVYIDEFDAFATESFATFLNKGRSSDFMIHLAHQTLSDLNKVSEDFAGQIMGNCNVRFVFRQDDPDDAERWARFFGTRTSVKKTYQTEDGTKTGKASNREVQEFRVAPDFIKDQLIGRCVFGIKTEGVLEAMQVPHPATVDDPNVELGVDRGEVVTSQAQIRTLKKALTKFEQFSQAVSATKATSMPSSQPEVNA